MCLHGSERFLHHGKKIRNQKQLQAERMFFSDCLRLSYDDAILLFDGTKRFPEHYHKTFGYTF